jgi:hypothetical protein
MKKHFIIFLTFFFALHIVWADNIYYNITQENSVSQIQTELQEVINNATSNDKVIVTGSKTDAGVTLTLNIATGKTVVWQATYQSSGNDFGDNSLIFFSGSGIFEVEDNAQLSITTGEVITSTGNNATITVSGGTLTATSGNAIVALGRDPQIYVSGGYLSNDAGNHYPVIIAYDPTPGSQALVHVSGTAKVEAKNMGSAVISTGGVKVSGDAQVMNNTGGDHLQTAIRASSFVEVSDNAKVTARHNRAILCNSAVISGGLVFAYGNKISNVISATSYYIDTDYSGVVIAWDKGAGNTSYEINSTDDIFKLPESATAYWDKKDDQFGISYANDENTGFIPLDVNVLSVRESALLNTTVYPNPTNGKVYTEVEGHIKLYNLQGILLKETFGKEIDLSAYPQGMYLLQTGDGRLVKVVKN